MRANLSLAGFAVLRRLLLLVLLACTAPAWAVTPVLKCDVNNDGVIDVRDISLIAAAKNTQASGPDDPRDADGNGVINLLDARTCQLRCTLAACAVPNANHAPVANAGPDQTVSVGETVHLNGTASTDVDGDPLTYSWTLTAKPAGSAAALTNPTSATPTFVADVHGTYTARLVVNDGHVNSASDDVTITTGNTRPVANLRASCATLANTDCSAPIGTAIGLSGSPSTDVDGDPLTFAWTLVGRPIGSGATLTSATGVNSGFTMDVPGDFRVQLIVNDGIVNSLPRQITVTSTNTKPTAVATIVPVSIPSVPRLMQLDGTGSTDPENQALTFNWSIIAKPANSTATLSNAHAAQPTFTADVVGTYTVQLIVNDGFLNSDPVTVTASTSNQPPSANAGPDQTLIAGSTVQLDGSGSHDPEGSALGFFWSFTLKPAGSLADFSNPNGVNPTFVADKKGTYIAQLIVNDGTLNSAPDTVQITATNRTPIAVNDSFTTAEDTTLIVGAPGVIANDTDADGDPLTATLITNVTHGSLSLNANGGFTYTPTLNFNGTDSFTYRVSDGSSSSGVATVTITVTPVNDAPVANAGANQNANVGQLVQLNGSCTDADNDPLTSAWTLSRPVGSTATLSNTAILNPTFTPDMAGTFTAQLVCNDTHVNSAPSQVTITVNGGTMTLALASPLITVGQTDAGTITLSTPAPGGGLQVTLVSSNNNVATVTSPVTIAAGSTTGSFTVTGAGLGPVTITGSAAGLVNGQVGLTVTSSVITVGNVTVTPGASAGFPVTLSSPAPAGGLTVNLTSSNTGVLTVPASVFIPAGASTASPNPLATGVTLGTATIQATATGFAPGSGTGTVGIAGTLAPNPASVVQNGGTRQMTLTLAQAAPAGGMTINLASANTQIATVPATVNIPQGNLSVTFLVTGGPSTGSTTLTASGGGLLSTQATINTTPAPNISLNSRVLGRDLELQDFGSLQAPAPAGNLTVTLTSSDPTKLLLSTSTTTVGSGSITVTVPAGQSGFNYVLQALANTGTVTVTANATAFATGTATITLEPSGLFINSPGNFSTNFLAANTNLQVCATSLNPTTLNNDGQSAIVRPGITVSAAITSSNTTVGTIVNSPTTIPAGSNCTPVPGLQFDPSTAGQSTLTLTEPAGFSTPNNLPTSIVATVTSAGINLNNRIIGRDLELQDFGNLQAAAPAGNAVVTLTSSDPTKVLVAPNLTTAGSASITVTVPAGQTSFAYVVQALSSTGTATVTASAPNFSDGTATITTEPSGAFINTPGNFTTNQLAANTSFQVCLTSLNPTTLNNDGQATQVRAGATVSPGLTSSNTTVGTIVNSPSQIAAGQNCTTFGNAGLQFDPASGGQSTITLVQPTGFSTPNNLPTSVVATVNSASFNLNPRTLGKDLQIQDFGTLQAAAPTGGVNVTLTSSDPTKVVLSSSSTAAGSGSLTVNVPAGQTGFSYVVQSLVNTGTAQVTASAPGFVNGTVTITLEPSGLFINTPGNFTTNQLAANTNIQVCASSLNPTTLNADGQSSSVRGGFNVQAAITSSNTSAGVIVNSPTAISGGSNCTPFGSTGLQFDPIGAGQSTLALTQPSGFSVPNNLPQSIVATVTAAGITLNNRTIGKDQEIQDFGSLQAPAPAGGVTVTLTSSDPTKLLLSTSGTTLGSASITVNVPQGQTSFSYFPQALVGTGTVQITASATGFTTDTATVTFEPSGFFINTPGNFTTTQLSPNTNVQLCLGSLNPTTLNLDGQSSTLRGGITASVGMTSSNTAVGTIVNSPATVSGGSNCTAFGGTGIQFNPASVGTSVLTIVQPSGFTTPSNLQQVTATVNAATIHLNPRTVGKDLELTDFGFLDAPAPAGGTTVTLTSSDATKLLLSSSPTAAGTASITVTVPENQTGFSYVVQALASTGTAQVTASASGFTNGTAAVTLVPSGFYINSPGNFSTTAGAANTIVQVCASTLNPTTLNTDFQASTIRGGLTANVGMTSSNTAVGTIVNSPVAVTGGQNCSPFSTSGLQFDPASPGTSNLTIVQPSGFTTPSNLQTITATVN